jgi:hypothetical protein
MFGKWYKWRVLRESFQKDLKMTSQPDAPYVVEL